MRTFRCTSCFTLLVAVLSQTVATGQDATGRRSVRSNERVARASWQPVRNQPTQPAAAPASKGLSKTKAANQVKLVDHGTEGVLPGPQLPPMSVVEMPMGEPMTMGQPVPMGQPMPMGEPLDGQVMLTPIHESGFGCDSFPMEATCGCDSLACDGGCTPVASCGGCGDCNSCCGELCSTDAWRPCVTLCLPQDGWASFEFLGWWQDGMDLPPLITTSTDPAVAQAQAGVLGGPTTRTLFGGNDAVDDAFEGGRLRFGVWLDRCHEWGIGAEYFQLGSQTDSFRGTSGGNPILARPFFNTQLNREDSELIAYPNIVSGTASVVASSELVGWGIHLRNLRQCDEGCNSGLFCGCPEHYCSRTEAMFGYRNLQLDESVTISEDLVGINPDNDFEIVDQFQTRNQFSGLDVGWFYRRTRGYWTADSMLRLAAGNTRQSVRINGSTQIDNGAPQAGGLLTQTSNIGTYKQDEFSVIPEFNANLGYQLTDHLRLQVGYTFIYWSNVVRPGQHISRDLNTDLLPPPVNPTAGASRPVFAFDTTDYWVQGINFGGEYRW